MEPVIGANIDEATKVAKEVLLRRISVSQTEELVKDRKEAVEKARVEAAKRAIGVMTSARAKDRLMSINLNSPYR